MKKHSRFVRILFPVMLIFSVMSCTPKKQKNEIQTAEKKDIFEYIQDGNLDEVINLVENDEAVLSATYNRAGSYEWPVLIWSLMHRQMEIADYLLEAGADPNQTQLYPEDSALTIACALGDVNLIKKLIKKGADVNFTTYFEKDSVFMTAVKYNQVEIMKILVENGADPFYVQDSDSAPKYHEYAFSLAAKNDTPDAMEYLASAGVPYQPMNDRLYPLSEAVSAGKLENVQYLVEHLKSDTRALNNEPLFISVARDSNLEITKYLIDHGASPKAVTPEGETPFFRAAYWGSIETAKYLYQFSPDINKTIEFENRTALMYAAVHGDYAMAEYLLSLGAKVNIKSTKKGASDYFYTAVDFATDGGDDEVTDLLQNFGGKSGQEI